VKFYCYTIFAAIRIFTVWFSDFANGRNFIRVFTENILSNFNRKIKAHIDLQRCPIVEFGFFVEKLWLVSGNQKGGLYRGTKSDRLVANLAWFFVQNKQSLFLFRSVC
jgi:hypothetical protein